MQHLSETHYYEDYKVPLLLRCARGGTMTLLLSDVPVASKPRQTLNDPSSTPITEPGLRTEVERIFPDISTTWTEGAAESTLDSTDSEAPDPSTRANRDRLVFLSRKYAGGCLPEEEARLEMLTERVRALLPRITEDDFLRLEEAAGELSTIHEENQRLRKKLSLG